MSGAIGKLTYTLQYFIYCISHKDYTGVRSSNNNSTNGVRLRFAITGIGIFPTCGSIVSVHSFLNFDIVKSLLIRKLN